MHNMMADSLYVCRITRNIDSKLHLHHYVNSRDELVCHVNKHMGVYFYELQLNLSHIFITKI